MRMAWTPRTAMSGGRPHRRSACRSSQHSGVDLGRREQERSPLRRCRDG
jgi:hypothetical protein